MWQFCSSSLFDAVRTQNKEFPELQKQLHFAYSQAKPSRNHVELRRRVSFDMICVLRYFTLIYGAAHVFAQQFGAMAFAVPKIVVVKTVKYTSLKIISHGTISNFHRSIGPSCLYTTTSNIWTASSDSWNDDVSQSMKNSEFAQEESSIWVDSSTSKILDDEQPSPNTVQKRRRVRYTGKYPKQFIEKYKELSGDATTIQKVLQKGMTPAGQHIPIMIHECMEHLGFNVAAITANDNHDSSSSIPLQKLFQTDQRNIFFVDCTLGYGGHSTHILKHLLMLTSQQPRANHQMVCFDRDPIEIVKATERLQKVVAELTENLNGGDITYNPTSDIVKTVNSNFCALRTHLQENDNMGKVTALLADLGLSSMQIDDASRGFTYKHDGPLDMRMNLNSANKTTNDSSESAYDLLQRLTVPELTKIIQENSDELFAPIIAQAIVGNKDGIPSTTLELANLVRDVVRPYLLRNVTRTKSDHRPPKINRQPTVENKRHYDSATIKKQLDSTVARVMQAIRIEVNAEFDSLQQLLDDLPYILTPNIGRAVILTFHSGEDRRVKKAFKQGYKDGIYSSWSRDVVRPTSDERYNNPRSSCCKLRWVIRSDKILSSN